MSTATATLHHAAQQRAHFSRSAWTWVAVLGGLFLWLHWSYVFRMIHIATKAKGGMNPWELLVHMVKQPWNPDWSHVLVVPLISFYFVARGQEQLVVIPKRVCMPGLLLFIVGLLSFNWWIYPGRNDMLQGFSMIIALFGVTLFLLGPSVMRLLWFPIVYLLLFVKISDRIWDSLAWKLQGVAAQCATFLLHIFSLVLDFDVSKVGNRIEISFYEQGNYVERGLEVAQACSGLRMLMAFIALGVAMAYLADRAWWQRLIMVLMAVPIAVAVNVARVTMLGLLNLVNEEMTKGDFHTFLGMLMLIPAAGLFWLLGWVLDRLLIQDEVEHRSVTAPPRPSDEAETLPRPIVTRFAAIGIGSGTVLSFLVGMNCYLFLMAFRPDIALQLLSKFGLPVATDATVGAVTAWVLMGVGSVATVAALIGLWRLMVQANGPGPVRLQGRGGMVALGTVGGVLFCSIFGFGSVREVYGYVMMKEPVPLRNKLYRLRGDFGPWHWIRQDPALPAEHLEVLDTRDYISYHLRDTTLKQDDPDGAVRWHMAYYTGKPDTVPHVPDRCYIGGGAVGAGKSTVTLQLSGPQYDRTPSGIKASSRLRPHGVSIPSMQITATLFRYHFPRTPEDVECVLYFFVANDRFLANPDIVRAQGFLPWDRYSYYCKVEIGLGKVENDEQAVKRASKFLSTMIPEIMACLPDWEAVNSVSSPGGAPNNSQTIVGQE